MGRPPTGEELTSPFTWPVTWYDTCLMIFLTEVSAFHGSMSMSKIVPRPERPHRTIVVSRRGRTASGRPNSVSDMMSS